MVSSEPAPVYREQANDEQGGAAAGEKQDASGGTE
jgi:hypothetical protein